MSIKRTLALGLSHFGPTRGLLLGFRSIRPHLRESVRFRDGTEYPSTRRIRELFETWRAYPELREESDQAYAAYDGGDVIDIGAFHGYYAALLSPKARAGSKVVLVEPDPAALPTLYSVVSDLSKTFTNLCYTVISMAAGDGQPTRVHYPMGETGHPRYSTAVSDAGERSIKVDDLVAALILRPVLIKIDVEGGEYAVLKGATEVLTKLSPRLMLEIHPEWQPEGVSADDSLRRLDDLGYSGRVLSRTNLSERQVWWKTGDRAVAGAGQRDWNAAGVMGA